MSTVIHVPATLSNLGPGFDVLGFAVTMHNTFHVAARGAPGSYWSGGTLVSRDQDLIVHTALRAAEHFGTMLTTGFEVHQEERLPRGRGLGSSATARVAGLLAWCHLTAQRPPLDEVLAFLSKEEGHPDNAVAALLGGVTLSTYAGGELHTVSWPIASGWRIALCIPDREVSTDDARRVLPSHYTRADVVFNSGRLAMLLHGLLNSDAASLRLGVQDRVHHPYRAPLIGPVDDAIAGAERCGAAAAFISGSGSTLAALILDADVNAVAVGEAMAEPFRHRGIAASARVVSPSSQGAWAQFWSEAKV